MEERRTIKSEVNVVIEQEDITNLLSIALYDGITYWCPKFRIVDWKHNEYDTRCYEEKAADHLFKGGKVTFYEDEDESGVEEDFIAHTVGLDEFLKGIHQYLIERGGNVIATAIREGETVATIEWGDIDSIEADCIIQYICFGELIYG